LSLLVDKIFIKIFLKMLIRKILSSNVKHAYFFGVDAKNITIGVPKEVFLN